VRASNRGRFAHYGNRFQSESTQRSRVSGRNARFRERFAGGISAIMGIVIRVNAGRSGSGRPWREARPRFRGAERAAQGAASVPASTAQRRAAAHSFATWHFPSPASRERKCRGAGMRRSAPRRTRLTGRHRRRAEPWERQSPDWRVAHPQVGPIWKTAHPCGPTRSRSALPTARRETSTKLAPPHHHSLHESSGHRSDTYGICGTRCGNGERCSRPAS
jgi:hypothetical protein